MDLISNCKIDGGKTVNYIYKMGNILAEDISPV